MASELGCLRVARRLCRSAECSSAAQEAVQQRRECGGMRVIKRARVARSCASGACSGAAAAASRHPFSVVGCRLHLLEVSVAPQLLHARCCFSSLVSAAHRCCGRISPSWSSMYCLHAAHIIRRSAGGGASTTCGWHRSGCSIWWLHSPPLLGCQSAQPPPPVHAARLPRRPRCRSRDHARRRCRPRRHPPPGCQ